MQIIIFISQIIIFWILMLWNIIQILISVPKKNNIFNINTFNYKKKIIVFIVFKLLVLALN